MVLIDQHCVDTLVNNSSEIGERKILCFFLVDPSHPRVSTEHIGDQRQYRATAIDAMSILPKAGNLKYSLIYSL
jgi:hypothetical protein